MTDHLGFYKGKTVLVTGGAGAIGSNLCKTLSAMGAEKVIILDNLSSAYKWNIPDTENVLFVQGDIRNDEDLRRAFKLKPTLVFHLAAFFANQNSVDYPLQNESVNTSGLLKMLEYSVLTGRVERFVFANSEGGAYGSKCKLPYSEADISIELGSPYYISKIAGEAYCSYYHRQFALPVSTVRLFNSYGPGEVPGQYRNVIPNFIFWALHKKPLPLTGTENMTRDFVFVEDIVDGMLRAGFYPQAINRPVNLASGREIRIHQLAHLINERTANPAGVNMLGFRKWDERPRILGDTTLAKELIGFTAQTSFEAGLERTISWFQHNWNQVNRSAEFNPGKSSALDVK